MDYRNYVRYFTFQQRLLEEEQKRIKNYLRNSSLGVNKEQYLEICRVTNSEIDPDKIPIEFSDFLLDTQIAMEIVYRLSDQWDGTTGTYIGKDLTILPFLLELYEIEDKFMKQDKDTIRMKCKCKRFVGIVVTYKGDYVAYDLNRKK